MKKEGITVVGDFNYEDDTAGTLNITPELEILENIGSYEAYAVGGKIPNHHLHVGTYKNNSLSRLFNNLRKHWTLRLVQDYNYCNTGLEVVYNVHH